MTPEQLQDRAFELADQSMHELLISSGIPENDFFVVGAGAIGLVDEAGSEVVDLADAAPEIQEAYEWLHARGLACIQYSDQGELILLKGLE